MPDGTGQAINELLKRLYLQFVSKSNRSKEDFERILEEYGKELAEFTPEVLKSTGDELIKSWGAYYMPPLQRILSEAECGRQKAIQQQARSYIHHKQREYEKDIADGKFDNGQRWLDKIKKMCEGE